jgi:hypothetical protein
MVDTVIAYKGFNDKLHATKEAAERSLLEEPYNRARIMLEGKLSHALNVCAYRPVEAIEVHIKEVKDFIKAFEAFHGKAD